MNPDGAAIVFKSELGEAKGTVPGTGVPVAVSHPYGGGRFTHVAFSFENIVEADRARAFATLLAAAGVKMPAGTVSQPAVATGGVEDAPRTFAVTGAGRNSFNFDASQAGPIRIQVQATGSPVAVTVFHPDGRTSIQSGQGSFVIADRAEAADLARGRVWAVSVRLSSLTPTRAMRASGSLIVTHPPVDEAAVKAQVAAAKPKTTVLGKAPPVRIVSTMPEAFRTANVARPVGLPPPPPAPVPAPLLVGVKRPPLKTIQPTVPAPVARFEVWDTTVSKAVPAAVVGVRQALYVAGTDLLPPGISVEEYGSHPQQYAAELHFEYGDGQTAISPLVPAGVYRAVFLGRVPAIPGVVDVPVAVFVKTADGRLSNRSALVYHPWLTTQVVKCPIVDYNVVNNVTTAPFNFLDWLWGYKTGVDPDFRLYDSALDPSYPDAHISPTLVSRDTYLFGFHGDDVFYQTLQLKNGWKTVSAKATLWESKSSGAEVVEFTPGGASLRCKVRWYLDPTFLDPNELNYHVEITIEGPADFPPL